MAKPLPYSCTISHSGLHKSKVIKGNTPQEMRIKAEAIRAQWNEQWNKKIAQMNEQECVASAQKETENAEMVQQQLDSILSNSLNVKCFDFEKLKKVQERQRLTL